MNYGIDYIRNLIEHKKNNIAFIIGNGINRYGSEKGNSWEEILLSLWSAIFDQKLEKLPSGISLTEIYDLLDLEIFKKRLNLSIQKKISDYMSGWEPKSHHIRILTKIKVFNSPILTTNFDENLSTCLGLSFHKFDEFPFTDFYPWGCYYSNKKLFDPLEGFGVWHINGMIKYFRSIRLGLTHYMGSVEKTRRLLHKGKEEKLFEGKDIFKWEGYKTWLHIIFNKSLLIFGLGLNENETFIRWLLIERAKYFSKHPSRRPESWYIDCGRNDNEGKKLFLENVGITYLRVNTYKEIYYDLWI